MIRVYETGEALLEENRAFLSENPDLACFFFWDAPLLGRADKINYAVRAQDGEDCLLALKVEPYNLLLYGAPHIAGELFSFLVGNGYEIRNYLCEEELGDRAAAVLASFGREYRETLAMRFMEARTVTEPSSPEVEIPAERDFDELLDCVAHFITDCGLQDPLRPEKEREALSRFRVLRREGKIVCIAKRNRGSDRAEKITHVYTRPEYRDRGLARIVVNTLKNEILRDGKIATLNVDRRNPVSCHLYAALGFEPVFSQGEYRPV